MSFQDGQVPRARIVYETADQYRDPELTTLFSAAGYQIAPSSALTIGDLRLIDLRGGAELALAKRAIERATSAAPDAAAIILVDPDLSATARKALRRFGELICVEHDLTPALIRCRAILRLRNIAEETGERLKTLSNANRLSAIPPLLPAKSPARILIAGAPGPITLAALNTIRRDAEQCVCVFSTGQTMRALDYAAFDLALFFPAAKNDPLMALGRSMLRHPAHARTPVMIISDDINVIAAAARRGVQEFMLARHIHAELRGRARTVIRRARLTRAMRAFLEKTNAVTYATRTAGVARTDFFGAHCARLGKRADAAGAPLSLVGVQLDLNERHRHALPHAAPQAAKLIARVIRAEDFISRITDETFTIIMAATRRIDAERAAARIEAFIESNVFRGDSAEDLFPVSARISVHERQPDQKPEEIVAGLLSALSAQSAVKQPPAPRARYPQ